MARVTLTAIAARSGLSKFAVSRALSGKSGVSDDTRRRVVQIAGELGYVRQSKPVVVPTIGVIFHDADLVNSELHYLIQNGVQSEAQRRGYHVRIVWTHVPSEIELVVQACDGVVLVGPHSRVTYSRIYELGTPIVRTGWLEPLEQVDFVGATDHEAGSAVANYLLALGHRNIAYVHGATGYRGRVERSYGMREVLERRNDVSFKEMVFEAETRFMEHLKALHAEGFNPTAFFCAHDGLAVTVVSELLQLGYRIPQDASVVGYGDLSTASQISPKLTTIKSNGREMGVACVRVLDDRMNGRMTPFVPLRFIVGGLLVERESSGPLATSGATGASRPAIKITAQPSRVRRE